MAELLADVFRPLGLKRLEALDSLEVHSTRTWTGSAYEVRECSGELLFTCTQEPQGCCSSGLGFNLTLIDDDDVELINFTRASTICLSDVEVRIQGALVGAVHRRTTCLKPVLELYDAAGTPVYRIKGPWHQAADFQYQLTTLDKVPLGAIAKKWSGWRKEIMSRRDDFIVTFPRDMDLKYKAICIGAAVYIIYVRRRQRRST